MVCALAGFIQRLVRSYYETSVCLSSRFISAMKNCECFQWLCSSDAVTALSVPDQFECRAREIGIGCSARHLGPAAICHPKTPEQSHTNTRIRTPCQGRRGIMLIMLFLCEKCTSCVFSTRTPGIQNVLKTKRTFKSPFEKAMRVPIIP